VTVNVKTRSDEAHLTRRI